MSDGPQKVRSRQLHVSPKQFSRLRAARVDGRTQNVFFRRNELNKLYTALIAKSSPIQDALMRDSGLSRHEAQLEYFLSLSIIRDHYLNISPERELEAEYSVANSQSAANRKIGYGLVHIVPSRYTLLYSVVAPLSAAIAAGNCIILELEKDLLEVSKILQRTLTESLDADTFALSDKKVDDQELLAECLRVDQDTILQTQSGTVLQGPVKAHTVAIVDRGADLQVAADYLVASRFLFKGKSPYAPDVVLVNEFVKKDFFDAIVTRVTRLMAESVDLEKSSAGVSEETLKAIRNSSSKIVITGSIGAVLDVKSRNDPLLQRTSCEPVFLVHSTSSLDDAIDFSNSFGTLLASYIFTTPKAAKYLSQFIDSRLCLINHMPASLLVGPACPQSHTPSPNHRYYPEMFSVPRPIFYDPSTAQSKSSSSRDHLRTPQLTSDPRALAETLKNFGSSLLKPLPGSESETARPTTRNIGFFEQGLFTGVGVLAVSSVFFSYGMYRGFSTGWTWLRHRS